MANLALIKSVAVHEAAHSCAAVRFCLGVEYAEVRFCTHYMGNMGYDAATCKKFAAGELLGSKLIVALAGPLGESMHLNGTGRVNPATFFGDWESVDGDVSCARDIAERLTSNLAERDDLLARSAETAYGHLLAGWPGVLALADFLFRHQHADAKAILSFFKR